MRLLLIHVSRFAFTATQKGRSSIVEPLHGPVAHSCRARGGAVILAHPSEA